MKVRSIVELEDIIAKEYAWRRKELSLEKERINKYQTIKFDCKEI